MTLAIALQTDRFTFGLTIDQSPTVPSSPGVSLLWLALGLAVAALGLVLDMVVAPGGSGIVALGPGALGLGLAMGALILEVKHNKNWRLR